MKKNHTNALPPKPKLYGQTPVFRVESDARDLTPTELERYRHFLPRDSGRHHHPYDYHTSSSRTRHCLRSRGSGMTHFHDHESRDASIQPITAPSGNQALTTNALGSSDVFVNNSSQNAGSTASRIRNIFEDHMAMNRALRSSFAERNSQLRDRLRQWLSSSECQIKLS